MRLGGGWRVRTMTARRVDPTATALQLHARLRPRYLDLALWWQLRRGAASLTGEAEELPLLGPERQGGGCSPVHLSLSGLRLEVLPRSLVDAPVLTPLQRLDLSFNELAGLNKHHEDCNWLRRLPLLIELNISNNRLVALPSEVGDLVRHSCARRQPWVCAHAIEH